MMQHGRPNDHAILRLPPHPIRPCNMEFSAAANCAVIQQVSPPIASPNSRRVEHDPTALHEERVDALGTPPLAARLGADATLTSMDPCILVLTCSPNSLVRLILRVAGAVDLE